MTTANRRLPCCTQPGCGGPMYRHSTQVLKVTGETKLRLRCGLCHHIESLYLTAQSARIEQRPLGRPLGPSRHWTPLLLPKNLTELVHPR